MAELKQTVSKYGVLPKGKALGYEWPGAYFVGEEELKLVARVVRAKSPFRYYGLDCQHFTDRFEEEFAGYTVREMLFTFRPARHTVVSTSAKRRLEWLLLFIRRDTKKISRQRKMAVTGHNPTGQNLLVP